jgi:hypothetical protein
MAPHSPRHRCGSVDRIFFIESHSRQHIARLCGQLLACASAAMSSTSEAVVLTVRSAEASASAVGDIDGEGIGKCRREVGEASRRLHAAMQQNETRAASHLPITDGGAVPGSHRASGERPLGNHSGHCDPDNAGQRTRSAYITGPPPYARAILPAVLADCTAAHNVPPCAACAIDGYC